MNSNTPTFKNQAEKDHYDKNEALFQLKPHVVEFIPFTTQEIKAAIESGDKHLNTLPLKRWDIAAGSVGWTEERDGKKYKSLSAQVSLLKHAAKYHYITD